jgi:hypothetical protein
MGQLGSRKQDDKRAESRATGPKVWLEKCSGCGRPLTLFAPERPESPRCDDCGPAAVAD